MKPDQCAGKYCRYLLILFLLSLIDGNNALAGENKWTLVKKIVVRNYNGSLNGIAIDPNNPKIFYAIVTDSIILKSTDNGDSWNKRIDGLKIKKIHKVIIHPFRSNEIYACAENGLYQSLDSGKNWNLIGFKDTPVYAIDIENDSSYQVKYVATSNHIYKFSNVEKSWQRLSNFSLPGNITITTLASLVYNSKQILYVGTNKGIYKFDDINLNTPPNSDLDSTKIVDIIVNLYPNTVILATDSDGIFWNYSTRWEEWRSINDGWRKKIPPIFSMNINKRKKQALITANTEGNIFEYKLTMPRIALVEFNSVGISPWELARISQYLFSNLKKTYSIKLVEKDKPGLIQSQTLSLESIKAFGRTNGFDIVISGLLVSRGKNIEILPTISYIASNYDTTLIKISQEKDKYYPNALKKVVRNINCEIKGKSYCFFRRYFWDGKLKWIWSGIIGTSLYYILTNCNDHKSNDINKLDQLPNP